MKKQEQRKHPRLPNGFGSIRYLGKGRTNPYAVHPGRKGESKGRSKALCYVPDWYTGMAVLAAWHAGQYRPGLAAQLSVQINDSLAGANTGANAGASTEANTGASAGASTRASTESKAGANAGTFPEASTKAKARSSTENKMDCFFRQMIFYFRSFIPGAEFSCYRSCTLGQAFEQFYKYEYGESASKKKSDSAGNHAKWAFSKLKPLEDRPLDCSVPWSSGTY